jgi:hypothetical protein
MHYPKGSGTLPDFAADPARYSIQQDVGLRAFRIPETDVTPHRDVNTEVVEHFVFPAQESSPVRLWQVTALGLTIEDLVFEGI